MSPTLLLASLAAFASPVRGLDSTIQQVEQMPWNSDVTAKAARHGLSVVNVTWEDTGRSKGSSMGPNISDMTIGVRGQDGALHPMPVFRFDNFNDKTADIQADEFILPVGNAWGAETLQPVTLTDMLKDTRRYLHDPRSWAGDERSLWNRRDDQVLVSAQACFLPVPKAGEATFTPVIYNYQSSPGNPAVMTIIASREGTSVQVVENDGGYMSEPLFFNADGERAPFTAARLSDVQSGRIDMGKGGPIAAAGEDAANVVLLIQVPLKYAAQNRGGFGWDDEDVMMESMGAPSGLADLSVSARSDVEDAVIGHGASEGPYKELHELAIERDTRFPVRVTVQFYKATSNGVVSDSDVAEMRAQIDRVYADASYVGSLVTDGVTNRPTEWVNPPVDATASVDWAWPHFGWLKAL
jgi:hypothetical protein